MLEDMKLQDFAEKTREAYLHAVIELSRYYNRSPDLLSEEDIRRFVVHLVEERGLARATVRQRVSGVKFFYETTLERPLEVFDRIRIKRGRSLPVVMNRAEVGRLLSEVRMPKYHTGILLGYTCGLRISEVLGLTVSDIDGERRQLRVRRGKGRKDRYVPLSNRVLARLRGYWNEARPSGLLFPSRYVPDKPMHAKGLQCAVRAAATAAEISKHVTFHTLRHCFATHLLECGVDLRTIQELMGHKSPETTAIYTHVTTMTLERLSRALDELAEEL